MKVAIIDDEKPARNELRYLIEQEVCDADISEFESGEVALETISKEKFDLLCIDISLGDISGTTLAAAARKILPDVEIVFATAYNHYAEKAFEVDAMYYLLKPFSEKKVTQMLQKYKQKHYNNIKHQANLCKAVTGKVPVYSDKKIILLDIDSIVYIEAQNRCCRIRTKQMDYKDNSTLNFYEQKLMNQGFFRIQKSYLINMRYVLEIYPWFNNTFCVKMDGFKDENLTISRGQIKNFKQLFSI